MMLAMCLMQSTTRSTISEGVARVAEAPIPTLGYDTFHLYLQTVTTYAVTYSYNKPSTKFLKYV
jgi:hypothetical protein